MNIAYEGTLVVLALIILLITPIHSQQTSLPPISFDEIHGDTPVLPASLQVVAIVDRPSYSQDASPSKQGGDIQTESPNRIDSKSAEQHSLINKGEEGQQIGSQLIWIAIIACSIVIIGGIAILLLMQFRNKDKNRMRLQRQIQRHIELEEKSYHSFSGFPSQ